MKKTIALLLTVLLTFTFSGCSLGIFSGADTKELQKDLDAFLNVSHAKIKYISIFNDSNNQTQQKQTTTMSYEYSPNGDLLYCLSQYDSKDNLVYYEFNDGTIYEEWLLGKGKSTYKNGDQNYVSYSKTSPHKYLSIINDVANKEYLQKCKTEENETGKTYTLEYSNKKLNKAYYFEDDYKVDSKKSVVSFNKANELSTLLEELVLVNNDKTPYGTCILDVTVEYSKVAPTIVRPTT